MPRSGGAFLALLWPRLADRATGSIALCAAAVALGRRPDHAAGVPVLVAGGVALLAGLLTASADEPTEERRDDLGGRSSAPASGATCSSSPGSRCPRGVLEHPLVERVADLIPVALLAALVAVQVFADGTQPDDRRPSSRAGGRCRRARPACAVPRGGLRGGGDGGVAATGVPRLVTSAVAASGSVEIEQVLDADASDRAGRRRRGRPAGHPGANDARSRESCRRVRVSPAPPRSTSWWATRPRARTECTCTPSTCAPRAPGSPVAVASGTGPNPASRRAAATSSAVRRAVPLGASALSGWCSSTISTDS